MRLCGLGPALMNLGACVHKCVGKVTSAVIYDLDQFRVRGMLLQAMGPWPVEEVSRPQACHWAASGHCNAASCCSKPRPFHCITYLLGEGGGSPPPPPSFFPLKKVTVRRFPGFLVGVQSVAAGESDCRG